MTPTPKKESAWIQTFTGRKFHPLDPIPEEVCIEDIAHALSMQCRFGGHCKQFYSVAEHSLRVSAILPPELQLWGLLHDAAEAYMIDMPRPIKHSGEMEGFREIEKRVQEAVCLKFGLPLEEPLEVKEADYKLLCTEARDLMSPLHPEWKDRGRGLDEEIFPYTQREAELKFTLTAIKLLASR